MKLTDKLVPILKELDACSESIKWVGDRTVQEAWNECERGDWMLWLYSKLYPENKRKRVLAAAHCANTVRNLMKDKRITKAVDVAIRYGEGNATDEELKCAYVSAADAYAAYDACDATSTYDAAATDSAYDSAYAVAADVAHVAYAAYDAAYAVACAAHASAYAATTDTATYTTNTTSRKKNQKQTANICRKYLKLEETC